MTAPSDADSSRFMQVKAGDLDLRLHYNDLGTATAGTLVMIHGSGPGASSWANFSRNAGPLTDAGYRVILMDCPGWSKSDPVVCTGARSELNARALAGLVDARGVQQRVHHRASANWSSWAAAPAARARSCRCRLKASSS